jgi:hypothetical protein
MRGMPDPQSDLSPLPDTPLGREYEVIGVARDSETLAPTVVYRPLYNATGLWVRPHAMFMGTVCLDGQTVARFQPLPP